MKKPGDPTGLSRIQDSMIRHLLVALLVAGIGSGAAAQTAPAVPIDTTIARAYFREVADLSARDGGRLWGRPLAGPLLFVDRASHVAVGNMAAETDVGLQPIGSLYTGTIPVAENVVNTAFQWGGRRWAMVAWPPPADSVARGVLLAHELWHRIQDSLGFPMTNPPNAHLASRDGRLWLRLEARALRRALDTDGSARVRAIRDALSFRAARRARFPGSDSTERALEMNEGLAEYSGVSIGLASMEARRTLVQLALAQMDTAAHFERSFAYQTGPAYGLLLDELSPAWRSGLLPRDDLPSRLALALGRRGDASVSAVTRGATYGLAAVRRDETTRLATRAKRVKAMRSRFVTGPTLTLPLAEIKLGFDPGQVETLDSVGTIYGSLRLTDRWGILQCDGSGGLIGLDFQQAVVPAPADTVGRRLTGPGWILELSPSWRLAPGKKRGDWTVVREP
jgi:hypothetical protein